MKQRIAILVFGLLLTIGAFAQHRIVFDLVSADTADQSAVLRQFRNVLRAAPDARLELVCHGKAVYMMVKEKASLLKTMEELKAGGQVSFKVCANSMRRYGIQPEDLVSTAEVVPVAILELAARQEEGWSYIRAGH